MHVQLTKLNEKIEFEVIENTDVLIFTQFNISFTSYELKLTSVLHVIVIPYLML